MMTATYSPDDNKLRLYSTERLDPETYERVKDAGFRWAPKQELFVAPMWTPKRADLLIELCGDIGDEDTSLVDRAAERAERFEEYSEARESDAASAHAAVAQVAQRFEFGQPILVGHHSERRARKDAERIQSGMRRAVKLWETSKYWEDRARGALRHAKYKELPAVRARRIKTIEADKRKQQKLKSEAESFIVMWMRRPLTREGAIGIANYDHVRLPDGGDSLWSALRDEKITAEEAYARACEIHDKQIADSLRWIEHYDFRLAYERAMLKESGGLAADKFVIEVGGQVFRRRAWYVVKAVNRSDGVIRSVSAVGHFAATIPVEEIADYRPPSEGDADKVKAATKLPPLVNYPGDGFVHMSTDEWKCKQRSQVGCVRRLEATETHGACRIRQSFVPGGSFRSAYVYLIDAKRVDRPTLKCEPAAEMPERHLPAVSPRRPPVTKEESTVFEAMKASLEAGIKTVVAPELFPTPPELARRLVEMADVQPGHRVLEPSAGTGNIVRVLDERKALVDAIEIDPELATITGAEPVDFLKVERLRGVVDRVVMNPPFSADIEHVTHALAMLKPGGRLVAVMGAGVTFRREKRYESFRALVARHHGTIEKLPDDAFKSSGTSVRAVVVTLEAPMK